MDFSDALIVCKLGSKIQRAGWNGAGMYVFLQAGYPEGTPINDNTALATGLPADAIIKVAPYLMFKDAKGVFFPWSCTQGDLLANDWMVVPN